MAFDVPILFIVFNRPDTTVVVFERIREMKPKTLFVAADGPRENRTGEKEKCEAVRKLIIDGIDWDCNVQTKFSDFNQGCGLGESSAMLWFFNAVGEGIVLEDDTLPDYSFFNYCKALLDYYRNDNKVFLISGDNFQNSRIRGDGTYYFSKYPSSWGYASWKRAWDGYDFSLSSIDSKFFNVLLDQQFSHEDEKEYWRKVYQDFHNGRYNTWDFQFIFNMWQKQGIAVIPNTNLVSNIGFGNNATHTVNADSPAANKAVGSISKIVHPASKKIQHQADRYLFKTFIKGEGTWQRRFRKLKHLFKV